MSQRLNDAIVFATKAHDGQVRKTNAIPYILHPLEVAAVIASITDDEDLMIAGLLHDTVEDTDVTFKEINAIFGTRVANLVYAETEDKLKERPPEETWKVRKEESLKVLKESKEIEKKILWLGDKLSNMRSIYNSYVKIGDGVFDYFNQKDKKQHEWYYRTIVSYLSELSNTAAYKELTDLIDKVFLD